MFFVLSVMCIILLCIAIFAAAAFLLARGITRASTAATRQWLGYQPPGMALRTLHIAAWICTLSVLILLPMKGCSYMQVALYRQAIPPQFDLREVVHHADTSGFREGCGFAVFRLSEDTLARIRQQGPAYFAAAELGRDGKPYHQYQPWRATPATEHDHLFRSQGCAGEPPLLLQQAQRAASQQGTFFTTGHEQDLVVVPALEVLIYSYSG